MKYFDKESLGFAIWVLKWQLINVSHKDVQAYWQARVSFFEDALNDWNDGKSEGLSLRSEIRGFVFSHAGERTLPILHVTHDDEDPKAADGAVISL